MGQETLTTIVYLTIGKYRELVPRRAASKLNFLKVLIFMGIIVPPDCGAFL